MPRKLRIEYEGAVYHVISRGNYRADVFGKGNETGSGLGRVIDGSAMSFNDRRHTPRRPVLASQDTAAPEIRVVTLRIAG